MDLSFRREPAAWLQGASVALGLLVAFPVFGLDDDTAAIINGAIVAIVGAITALRVRPIAPTVFASAIGATAVLTARFGLEFNSEQVGAVQTAVALFIFLTTRDQQEPVVPARTLVQKPARTG